MLRAEKSKVRKIESFPSLESSALATHYFYNSKSDVGDHYLSRSKNLNEDFEKRLIELEKKSQKSSFSPSLTPSFQFI